MRFANNLKTTLLLGALMGLCMLIGHWFLGPNGVLIGFMFGGIGNIMAYFFSDKIALASMGGREITRDQSPRLFNIIEQLCARAGLPMPRVYVCPQQAPNAFATGRDPNHAAVAITQGMLQNFPEHEIEGVLAHELGHVKHRDMLISTIAAVMAGVISYAGYMLMFFGGGRRSDNPLGAIGALLMIILAPLAAVLIRAAISREREYAADSYSGELTGNPLKLVAALERLQRGNAHIPTNTPPAFHNLYIVEPMAAGGVQGLFGSHPPTEKRIEALREQAARMR